jgi:SPP1 gp7 family putative phage head morphogenesis protein
MYRGYDFPYDRINNLITEIGGAAAAENYAAFAKQFPNSSGGSEEWLAQTFEQWRKNEIMRLMQSQQNEQLKVGRLINNARAEGVAVGNLVKAYTGDRARKHAVFEMRNASANLNAAIDQHRMQEAGIDCYRWRTGNDEKVRPAHKEMQNQICRFDDPSVYYDKATKTWVPRTDDMVHKHPGEDYNCRCTASPYLMEIDEKTGKYGKGTDDPEEIEEILREDEFEYAERLAGEFDKKQFMEGLDSDERLFFGDWNKRSTAWSADEANMPYAKNFMQALMARAQSDGNVKNLLLSLHELDKRLKASNGRGFRFRFMVPARGGSKASYSNGILSIDLTCWLSPHRRVGGNKTLFKSALHEIMHAMVSVNPRFRKAYLNNLHGTIMEEMKGVNAKAFEALTNAREPADVKAALKNVWKHYVDIAKANGNDYWEASVVPFTDFTHSIISENLSAWQISRLNMKNRFKEMDGVVVNAHKRIGFHPSDYYIARKEQDKLYGSTAANEFMAHAGSLFFTDKNLFNIYAKEMPGTFRAVEKLIATGGATHINLYFNPDNP